MPEEIGLLLVAAVWLLLWTPAIAAAAFAAPRVRDLLRRRQATERLSRVVPAAIWVVVVVAYIPIFVVAFLSFLDLLGVIYGY